MSDEDDLFESSKALLSWAGEEIEEFNREVAQFGNNCEAKEFVQPDLATSEVVHGYKILTKPPEKVRKLAYRIVNDLRNSLDQSVHAASLLLDTPKPTKTNFPVADTPEGVIRRLASPSCSGIPPELHDKILSFNAFWPAPGHINGNVLLRALLENANPNKHRVAITAGVAHTGLGIHELSPNVTVNVKRVADGKYELFRVPFNQHFNIKMNVEISLMFATRGLNGLPATIAMEGMARAAQTVLDDLETEALRLASLRH